MFLLDRPIFRGHISFREDSPQKINIEPENDGLVQMMFFFQGCILRFHVNLPGCIERSCTCIFGKCQMASVYTGMIFVWYCINGFTAEE